jgi:transcriptional regulator with XRE-family HTH domain
VRATLRAYLADHQLTQKQVAERLAQLTGELWSQPRLAKVLAGTVEVRLDDLAAICWIIGLSLVEAVREPGREYVADLTPSELELLRRLRENPHAQTVIDGLLAALPPVPQKRADRRALIKARMARLE